MIVTASALATSHRDLIIALADRLRLPAVYPIDASSTMVALFPTDPILSTNSGKRPATLIAS
jgi:hypothetical protein